MQSTPQSALEGLSVALKQAGDHYGLIFEPVQDGSCVSKLMDAANAYAVVDAWLKALNAENVRLTWGSVSQTHSVHSMCVLRHDSNWALCPDPIIQLVIDFDVSEGFPAHG